MENGAEEPTPAGETATNECEEASAAMECEPAIDEHIETNDDPPMTNPAEPEPELVAFDHENGRVHVIIGWADKFVMNRHSLYDFQSGHHCGYPARGF